MKDKSFEEINIVKILILTLSFISVCTALILFLLLPTLKAYKELGIRENSQIALLNATKAKLNTSEVKLAQLRSENNKSLEQFQNSFSEKNFQVFLSQFFKKIQIKAIKNQNESYLKHTLLVNAYLDTPKNLYDFIDALQNYDNLIKMDYPLKLKAQKSGIELSFVAKIYGEK
ncbi:hypothetical protein [Campylobacter vulpis]|uniref:hypothetical protein n=1 Tax=Campylobacter vulpis TaxID=1655500 RepID=UPI001BCD0E98|nr:hypothetical protein [Campylobacter vulpis]MBS4235726.1 hypothetical protein [Campylobacter vulpis]MBS4269317.1 hypothetical protein [Campylobacter vulpis]